MSRSKVLILAGVLLALSGARLASAQTQNVALISIQSGNGQVACPCVGATLHQFQPITIKATDVHGNPVSGATVNWTVTLGQMILGFPTTTTLVDGTSTNTIVLNTFNTFTSIALPYLVETIQATSNSQSATFTETESLITTSGASVIAANNPTFGGVNLGEQTLSGNVGTTLPNPIQVMVGGLENASSGVPNVSVRIFNNQTSPSLTCAYYGGYADPGSVLSGAQGITSCYPILNGSGNGTFYILVGGVPGSDTNIADAEYLQAFGPFNFTSIPGAPAAVVAFSGNNQVANVDQAINPVVAKLVDANGNAVQGQTMTWTVSPYGAVALTNTTTVTDNNGEVSSSVALFLAASTGAQIVVALQSNPSISVTFQESLTTSVTALNIVGGNGQSAQTGTNFAQPLTVQVLNGTAPVANFPVQFSVSGPISLAQLGTTVETGANGQASVSVVAGSNAGTGTVTAIVGLLSKTFTLTVTTTQAVPPPSSMTLVGGSPQSAIINTSFTQPLVVQVNNSAGALANYVVNFSGNGSLILSSSTATTGSNGQAQITVQAGSTPGTDTVTASVPGGFTSIFTLTVLPPGPTLSANSFLNAASGQVGYISPCGLATISAPGLTPAGISALSPAPIFGSLPYSVNGLSVNFAGLPAPIVNVAMGSVNPQVTVQVPCEVTPGSQVPVTVTAGGGGNATINTSVLAVSPGIFQTKMSDGISRAVVVRSNGQFADVGGAVNNPARRNEYVRVYVTGMGPTNPFVDTNNIQDPNADLVGSDASLSGVQAAIVGYGGLQVISARLAPDLIGVYEIQVALPGDAPTGNNVQIEVHITPAGASSPVYSTAALIPIQ